MSGLRPGQELGMSVSELVIKKILRLEGRLVEDLSLHFAMWQSTLKPDEIQLHTELFFSAEEMIALYNPEITLLKAALADNPSYAIFAPMAILERFNSIIAAYDQSKLATYRRDKNLPWKVEPETSSD